MALSTLRKQHLAHVDNFDLDRDCPLLRRVHRRIMSRNRRIRQLLRAISKALASTATLLSFLVSLPTTTSGWCVGSEPNSEVIRVRFFCAN